ncbi:potassium channel family protein [Thermospira aquatica]|uniref:Potassium channel protein n=1 Tax=Thermospira aquatica TaxID=2828656 RepID=A0AAX3BBW8_9SPIR|nr:potassium channel protein [Thermospira aquatica]URA09573.1 potassium channel protein [Thermospira aquatica]
MQTAFFRRIFFFVFVLFLLLLVGTVGYMSLEGWHWFDALYMSVIVVTTLGFQEIHPLSAGGRFFTILYSLGGIIVFVGILSLLGVQIIESYLSIDNRRKRMLRELFMIRQHYIVCGCGKVGKHVIETLLRNKKRFVGIDIDPKNFERLKQEYTLENNWLLEGDATDEDVLLQAGIDRATAIFCCVRDDIKNLFIAMSAKQLNPHIKIATYVIDEKNIRKFQQIGVDEIISGDFLIGRHLASTMLNEHFLSFVGELESSPEESVFVGEVVIEPDSFLIGKSLRDADIYQNVGLLVFAIRRGSTTFYNPHPGNTILESGDKLVVFGEREKIQALDKYVNG